MNLVVATIPDDPAALADWLERQLTGLDLARLVTELTAIHKPTAGPPAVDLLAAHLPAVYASGLKSLPPESLRQLLTRPALLQELQELILTHGGPYWDQRLAGAPALETLVEQGRLVVSAPKSIVPAGSRRAWYQQAWVVSLATAAAILLLIGAWNQFHSAGLGETAAWGWDRPGALRADLTRTEYLTSLADEAQEWFAKRPDDSAALARRIGQFRQGCSTLILALHEPLPPADRAWLVERCRSWAGAFDQALAGLERGEPAASVRQAMDAKVHQLSEALRKRAAG